MNKAHKPEYPSNLSLRRVGVLGAVLLAGSGTFAWKANQSSADGSHPNIYSKAPALSTPPRTAGFVEQAVPGDNKYVIAERVIEQANGTIRLTPMQLENYMHTEANPDSPYAEGIVPGDDVIQRGERVVIDDVPLSQPPSSSSDSSSR